MIALLDANVLIALFDAAHVDHAAAHEWFAKARKDGWATCPLTENACVRIMSQPSYPGRLPVADIARRLRQATESSDHTFWPDSVRVCDPELIAHGELLSSKHLTDLYLLALATELGGRLVTFDRKIPRSGVVHASEVNLLVL